LQLNPGIATLIAGSPRIAARGRGRRHAIHDHAVLRIGGLHLIGPCGHQPSQKCTGARVAETSFPGAGEADRDGP